MSTKYCVAKLTNNKFLLSVFILAVYFFCSYGWDIKRFLLPDLFADNSYLRDTSVQMIFFLLIPVLATWWLYGGKNLLTELGIDKGFSKGLLFGFVATIPMAIGYAIVSGFSWNMDLTGFMYGSVQAPFTEEIIFRAFLFGLLYRKAGWSLWAATLFDGIVFGAIHIYQGDSAMQAAMVFLASGAGAVWFSWMFKEWNWNLWIPMFLHAFMNFWWGGFEMADNAAGGLWANVFRVMTIAFTVYVTNRPALQAWFGQRVGDDGVEPQIQAA